MKKLILQVLGKSDIIVDGKPGYQQLEGCSSYGDIQQKAAWNDEDLINQLERVDFPLIKQVCQFKAAESEQLFCPILTNQVKWLEKHSPRGEAWNSIAASDGIWWQNILSEWCQQQHLDYYPLTLDVSPDVKNGVADWEGMAKALENLLNQLFVFENHSIYFQPTESERIQIDKIIVQHSSGTPALSSALYLWGTEQKLAGNDLEFVYISEQDQECYTHPGEHWQWRLKVPQIRQLLEIQDFSGALRLLDRHSPNYECLETNLSFLDKSVSLSLDGENLEGRDSIIERISIALWSEKAFRDRSQWMHWSLRVAGALELALLLLLEKQSNGNYKWNKNKLNFKHGDKNVEVSRCSITSIVNPLLIQGEFDYIYFNQPAVKLVVSRITDDNWLKFKDFYLDNWKLEEKPEQRLGFNSVRNQLYHSLIGDRIDRLLDDWTKKLNEQGKQVDSSEHPSQIAVNWLEYIIQLAGVSEDVEARTKVYRDRVSEIFQQLNSNEHPKLVN